MKMSDALHAEEGMAPWLPAHDVVAGQVLDFYDVPRVGLLHQSGHTYYFECIIGDGQDVGIWAYSLLAGDELQTLLAADGPTEFDELTPRFIEDRWVTLAIVANDRIVETAVLDAGTEGATGLAQRMMKRWELQRQARESATKLVRDLEAV